MEATAMVACARVVAVNIKEDILESSVEIEPQYLLIN